MSALVRRSMRADLSSAASGPAAPGGRHIASRDRRAGSARRTNGCASFLRSSHRLRPIALSPTWPRRVAHEERVELGVELFHPASGLLPQVVRAVGALGEAQALPEG